MPRGVKLNVKKPTIITGNKVAVIKATSLPVASHTPTPTPSRTPSIIPTPTRTRTPTPSPSRSH
jgi:hypothetical protein